MSEEKKEDIDKKKRKCEICSKVFSVKKERLRIGKGKSTDFYFSEYGVYFEEGNVWFCNDCFSELTKNVDFNKIVGDMFHLKGENDEE